MNIIERLDLLFVNRPKRGEARKVEWLVKDNWARFATRGG
jgi:hypothetical protein